MKNVTTYLANIVFYVLCFVAVIATLSFIFSMNVLGGVLLSALVVLSLVGHIDTIKADPEVGLQIPEYPLHFDGTQKTAQDEHTRLKLGIELW